MSIKVISPIDRKPIKEVPSHINKDVIKIIENARKAFTDWSLLSFKDRAEYFCKLRGLFLKHSDEMIETISRETGKTNMDALVEVFGSLDTMKFYEKKAEKYLRERKKGGRGMTRLYSSCYRFIPHGVVGVISPWNYPLMLSISEPVPALMASGNHNCASGGDVQGDWTDFQLDVMEYDKTSELCDAYGSCKLQELAYKYQISDLLYELRSTIFETKYELENVNPFKIRDFSRCILCGRCINACNEVVVNRAINIGYRGFESKITAGGDSPYIDSDCVFCGQCLEVCPVGALIDKKAMGSYMWEEEIVRTTCPYCGVGCQMWLHIKEGRIVRVSAVEDGAPNMGRLCVKGRFGYDFIYSEDRLKTPLIKENDGYREASWDEALDMVAAKFKDIIAKNGPDALAGVSCARSINEDSYQMQKLFRAALGTNNIDHCART